ncbi:reverse transcriptase domain-containing protein [Tanacetum coccineum]
MATDHLSRLENPDLGTFTEDEITDEFPDEHLMILKAELNDDEPCASITGRKVYESRFFWPGIFKDAKDYVMKCDACQRSGNISPRSEMPQNNIQTNRQTKVTNRAIKRILERSVGYNPKNWSEKLDDALWAFKTAYKTHTGCTPFRLVYGKACYLPVEIKHKAYWALKKCNIDLTDAIKNHFMELIEIMELRDRAYENTHIYKKRTKKWHDSSKLKSRWYRPNVVKTMYPYGTIEIVDRNEISFKVNGQRLKKYHDEHTDAEDKEVVEFEQDGMKRSWRKV